MTFSNKINNRTSLEFQAQECIKEYLSYKGLVVSDESTFEVSLKKDQIPHKWFQRLYKIHRQHRDVSLQSEDANDQSFAFEDSGNPEDHRSWWQAAQVAWHNHWIDNPNHGLPNTFTRFKSPHVQKLFKNLCDKTQFMRCGSISGPGKYIGKIIEDIWFLYHYLINAKNFHDVKMAVFTFMKFQTNDALLSVENLTKVWDMFKELVGFNLQSEDNCQEENWFRSLRAKINVFQEMKESLLYKKLYKFLMYMLSLSVFGKVGVTMTKLNFTVLQQEAIRKKYHMGADFVYTILDTLVFLCERGAQYLRTGNLDSFLHNDSTYAGWMAEATKLIRNFEFYSNPEPHNFTQFGYMRDINDCIDKGKSIASYVKTDKTATKIVTETLSKLILIKSQCISKVDAQKNRDAPFGVLVSGASSVAKSAFTEVLFHHYAKLFKLPNEDEFRYVRNAVDEYWVNFNSSQWCVLLDDIAFLNPNNASGGDPSMMQMLQVMNNVPFVPTQAALEDKGKTPMRSRFVIATTNTPDLNVNSYFSCPLAVSRRFPFIINIRPKKEYLKDNCMIDGSKLPEVESGEYPNFWEITVSRVVPHDKDAAIPKHSTAEVVETFSDIYDFIVWFSKTAKHHYAMQQKAKVVSKSLSEISLCDACFLPSIKCQCVPVEIQSEDVEDAWVNEVMRRRPTVRKELSDKDTLPFKYTFGDICRGIYFKFMLYLYYSSFNFVLASIWGDMWFYTMFYSMLKQSMYLKFFMKCAGNRVSEKIGVSKFLLQISGAAMVTYGLYKTGKKVLNMFHYDLQGNNLSKEDFKVHDTKVGSAPKPDTDARVNVWYKDDYETTNFDVSPTVSSAVGLGFDRVAQMLSKNCVHATIRRTVDGVVIPRHIKMICIGGNNYITNNHNLPPNLDLSVELIHTQTTSGVNGNLTFLLTQSEIKRYAHLDLAALRIRNLPPKKVIVDYFCKDTFRGQFCGSYIKRDMNGEVVHNELQNIRFQPKFSDELGITLQTWSGYSTQVTLKGDCGSMLLANAPCGPVILGMHSLGNSFKNIFCTRVTQEFLNQVTSDIGDIVIQSGTPSLSTDQIKRELVPLHRKCPLRYIEDGVANTYGSFSGFKVAPKSSVQDSVLAPELKKHGYEKKYDKPVMSSWEPWHIAIKEMINPVTMIRQDLLKNCVDEFTHDIFNLLPKDALSSVMVYDDFTAINGAAGVTYVDKLNRNTSMGNPWKKSKKFYLHEIEGRGETQDAVTFEPEVMQRVEDCINKYKSGERYMACFCAHLKDEATSYKKIKSKKTRVFTGAPIDYSIVVRKYLLSIIKLIQSNRFVFDSAPGTIAQSLEWQEIREYLTQFGDDRLVAGDYGKFDKRMPPTVIMAAFDIIKNICKKAGYSDEDLTVVSGIANDTAYPLIDFNGDLIEFYGSNPSGHPLTVIINGLVNVLYIRYCFKIIVGDKLNFKENVALMTYGDDNAMGISPSLPQFNHTSIQKVLADVGIVYTMADKEAESVPFIHIDDVSFLKRTWRWEPELDAYVCPLEHESIEKMLMVNVASKTIAKEAQAIAVVSTALREYFWYGREIFEKKQILLKGVVSKLNLDNYVEESTFPTFDSLKSDFKMYSKSFKRKFKSIN